MSDSRFSSSRDENGNVFVTLGAHNEFGLLRSRMNRAEEIAPHSRGINLFPLLSCFNENALIERLLSLFANYQNNTDYDLLAPWFWGAGYNSNSFARGLISAAGLNVPHLPSSLFPAWNHPLPPSAFGKKQ